METLGTLNYGTAAGETLIVRFLKEANLSDERTKILLKKVDELEAALEGKRLSFTKVMIALTALSTAVVATEQAIIKLPDTISAIHKVLGKAKEEEDSARPAPPKALTDQTVRLISDRSQSYTGPRESFSADLDDEIPF